MGKLPFSSRCWRKLSKIAKKAENYFNYQKTKTEWTVPARKRLKLISGGYNGSLQEYRNVVLPYWRRFGLKPEKFWYDLYCAGMNAYDPRFIPDSVWFCEIRPYFNNISIIPAYSDKGMYHKLLPDVKQPETVVKNINGYYYNGDGESIITREEAEQLCTKEKHLILKPSLFTYGGSGIQFYDGGNGNSPQIGRLFNDMKKSFVVQRLVKQHPDLERLNPSSLNTLRVLSFHFRGQVHILSAQLRIGGNGSRVDNVSAGGCACAVENDGRLREKAVNRQSVWVDETPSGIKFRDITIPNYQEIVKTIKKIHCELPYLNILGWDFAVGEDGTPILVEFNTMPGQNQIGGKEPTFGDMTDDVLEEVFVKKSMKNR